MFFSFQLFPLCFKNITFPHAQTNWKVYNDLLTRNNIHQDQAIELSRPVSILFHGLVRRNNKQVKTVRKHGNDKQNHNTEHADNAYDRVQMTLFNLHITSLWAYPSA